MGFFDSFANLPIALGRKTSNKLDSVNCTTADYLNFKVVFSRLYTPNCKWKITASQFTRLTPMLKPAFANATFENRLFFVPYRTVYKDFNHLVDGTQAQNGVVPDSCTDLDFFSLLLGLIVQESDAYAQPDNELVKHIPNSDDGRAKVLSGGYDLVVPFLLTDTNKVRWFFYDLTAKGKQVIDLLINLGYNFPFYRPIEIISGSVQPPASKFGLTKIKIGLLETQSSVGTIYFDSDDNESVLTQYTDVRPTCLALASSLKVYFDYYLSGRGSRTNFGFYIEECINYLTSHNFVGHRGETVDYLASMYLRAVFKFLTTLYYDDDYFTTISPTYMDTFGTTGNGIVINDPSVGTLSTHSKVVSDSTNTTSTTVAPHANGFTAGSANSNPYNFTQYIVDSLMALTKYMRRNNIVGWRQLDRYMAHYGAKLEPAVLNRSLYLGKFLVNVGIDAIFQQAGTSEDILGSYAGIGIGGGKGNFTFESKEFGQLIMISVCKPDVNYYQGLKREMLDKKRFEFFAGEFDNLGYQAVARCELVNSYPYNMVKRPVRGETITASILPDQPNAPAGFQPRYAHLKCSTNQDVLSGDFRIHASGAVSYDYFHQFRSIGKGLNISSSFVIDDNFRDVRDRAQFDRIFANQDAIFDHFITFFSFKVDCFAPWSKLFDSLDFGDELHNGQPTRNVHVGGTKF